MVISLSDVEIAYLERVQFHLKNFDIVFVLKDFTHAPLHINSIPMSQIENIKEWLEYVVVVAGWRVAFGDIVGSLTHSLAYSHIHAITCTHSHMHSLSHPLTHSLSIAPWTFATWRDRST